jgi:L-ascorbate metabolism protein UlaG (beta-lactamase superfamily)
MPDIDLLIISHDHYDHLDYATIKALMPKIKRVVTPLGVGRTCATGEWRARSSARRTGISRCR